jgi:transcriptional regulator
MYNPHPFRSTDTKEVFELMDQNPFATVITVVEGKLFTSHLPLTPKKVGDKLELVGHLARSNSHWKSFADSKATVIFHGPHTYITPKWYTTNDVPTWNYVTAHVTGKIELIDDRDGIVDCLKELTAHVERNWPSGWEFLVPNDLTGEALQKSIVGFRMKIDGIDFKKKLSQNRQPADRAGVLKGLEDRGDDHSRSILSEMRKLFSENGESKGVLT